MAFPRTDTQLRPYSTNFNDRLVAGGTSTYHLTAGQVTAYTGYHTAYVDALTALESARDAGIRNTSLSVTKEQAKRDLLRYGREIYALVQSSLTIADADKVLLGVVVRDTEPTPVPPPAYAPGLEIKRVDGRVVQIQLTDPGHGDRKRLPPGVQGAIIMSYVGETAPLTPSAYTMQGPTSRMKTLVEFPADLAAGTKVWLCAVFFNGRKQMGPACLPVGTQINYPASLPMAG